MIETNNLESGVNPRNQSFQHRNQNGRQTSFLLKVSSHYQTQWLPLAIKMFLVEKGKKKFKLIYITKIFKRKIPSVDWQRYNEHLYATGENEGFLNF